MRSETSTIPLKKEGRYRFAEFEVDLAQGTLRRDGHPVLISPRTFDLLAFLVLNAQRTVTKEELMRALWRDSRVEESNLSQHIFILRKALSGIVSGDKLILSIPGKGFQFTPNVSELAPKEPEKPQEQVPPIESTISEPSGSEPRAEEHAQSNGKSRASHWEGAPEHDRRTQPERRIEHPGEIEHPPAVERRKLSLGRSKPLTIRALEEDQEDTSTPDAEESQSADSIEESKEGTKHRRPGWSTFGWRTWALAAALVLVVGLASFLGWRRWHHGSASADMYRTVVISDFNNTTGDASLDQTLNTALAIDLSQSPYLKVATDQEVQAAAKPRELKPVTAKTADNANALPTSVTAELAQSVCESLKGQNYLTGEVHKFVHKYLVTVEAFDCATGERLARSRGIADNPDGAMRVLDKVAADIREQLGEPAASVQKFNKPLFAEHTGSLDALKSYADASRLEAAGRLTDAVPLYLRALELDREFAMAYAHLGAVYSILGANDLSVAALTNGYQLRDTVSERNRYFITSTYNDVVTGNIQASIRNDKEWSDAYPHDPVPLTNMADLDTQIGKSAQAIEPAKRALELNPDNEVPYIVLARAQMNLGQPEEAAQTCRRAFSRHIDSTQIHGILLQLAFLRLDQPAIDEQLAWAKGKPAEPYMQWQQGLMDFALGKAKAAQAAFATAAEGYRNQGQSDRANRILSSEPRIEAELGLIETAHAQLTRLTANTGAADSSVAGFTDIPVAWAHVGETGRAAADLKKELDAHPTDTLWQEFKGPQIKAAIALNQRDPDAAIDALRVATPYDLRSFDGPALRGKAFLASQQAVFAEAEFHKILDHQGIEPLSHNYPLAQLGAARALAAQGKTSEAGFAYKVVLQIWKDADPDLPRLRDAKAEYAKLGSTTSARPTASSKPSPVRR